MTNKELIRIAVIALIFFGIGAAAAESNLNTFTLRADRVLAGYIGGNVTADEVNITGLMIKAGQVLGYYNESATDALLDIKANASNLTSHTSNTSNPHNVTAAEVGGAVAIHSHAGTAITSSVSQADYADTVDGIHLFLSDTLVSPINGSDNQLQYDGVEYSETCNNDCNTGYVLAITWNDTDISTQDSDIYDMISKVTYQQRAAASSPGCASGAHHSVVRIKEDGVTKSETDIATASDTGWVTKTVSWLSNNADADIEIELRAWSDCSSPASPTAYLDETYLNKYQSIKKIPIGLS
ncbi:MAG: hypothetical protein V3R93_05130 [Candidatus Hydrothermarchaeaceae archaeon]